MLISNTSDNTSFTFNINHELNTHVLNDSSSGWLQFLQDHREYIINKSKQITISPNDMAYYKFRISKYLKNKGYGVQCALAFRIINHIKSDADFNESITEVYIPSTSVLNELRRSYTTLQSQIKKL